MEDIQKEKGEHLLCYNGPIGNGEKHNHLKIKIGVSGAAETGHCGLHVLDAAKEIGREVIKQGGVLVTGATSGFPLWASIGAKEERGLVVGLSPATSEHEHITAYRLPLDYTDLIIYTGFGFPGRDLLFTRSCDALIVGCGRVGTIHEFTIAFEDGKPIGILEGEWATDEILKEIMDKGNRQSSKVIFDTDPKRLVERVLDLVKKDKDKEFSPIAGLE
jgi:uncharacterized protein (TIGR00725 family)